MASLTTRPGASQSRLQVSPRYRRMKLPGEMRIDSGTGRGTNVANGKRVPFSEKNRKFVWDYPGGVPCGTMGYNSPTALLGGEPIHATDRPPGSTMHIESSTTYGQTKVKIQTVLVRLWYQHRPGITHHAAYILYRLKTDVMYNEEVDDEVPTFELGRNETTTIILTRTR